MKPLPRIFFCGDPHGSFDQINTAAREHKPDAMVILGDMQPPAPLNEVLEEALAFTQIWWIPGNHDSDTDSIYDNLWRSELAQHNLHGRVATVAGMRIAGLGGVFRGMVWMPDDAPNYFCPATFIRRVGAGNMWRGGLPRRHRTTIFPSVYQNLMRQHADILITHEAPGCHRKGFSAIDRLADALGVKWLFHGHQHEDRVYGHPHGIVTLGVGYRGITSLSGEVIVPAQLDPREAAALRSAISWAEGHGVPTANAVELPAGAKPAAEPKVAPVPVVDPSDPQEHMLAEQAERRNRALIAESRPDPKREAELGRAVAARAPGGRWKRFRNAKKKKPARKNQAG
ncbi:metallophosphoesterase [Sutterella sp.]|uniref:metallophosphoesterase family protein n=1 Tax=Sutterella sp. TaxID=1981025 RepID=UPI0026E04ABB|nr:metallophosphoesterase [Sutterella sp.]MDO5531509.1 metallophosphoesterase [Sutterella sp.]